jgi:hypothetical protein
MPLPGSRKGPTMPDQQGQYCPEHDPQGYHCACDEGRDRAAGIHRASGLGNAFGGYVCVCGNGSWTMKSGCTSGGRSDPNGPAKTARTTFYAVVAPRWRVPSRSTSSLGPRLLLRWEVVRETRQRQNGRLDVFGEEHHSAHWTRRRAYRAAEEARHV